MHKRPIHGLSCLQTAQKCITELEILAQHLQQGLRLYEDPTTMENLTEDVGENKTMEEQDYLDEETLISWSKRMLKIGVHKNMSIKGNMMAITEIIIIMRGMTITTMT